MSYLFKTGLVSKSPSNFLWYAAITLFIKSVTYKYVHVYMWNLYDVVTSGSEFPGGLRIMTALRGGIHEYLVQESYEC